MRLIKFSLFTFILGLACFLVSYFAAGQLEQAKAYTFPESIARHYAQVSGRVFEGEAFGDGTPTEFRKTIAMDPNASQSFDTVDIETTAVRVEVAESKTDVVEIELYSNKVDPKEPVLIDTSRGRTLRVMTQEGSGPSVGSRGWMVFSFDDSRPKRKNVLVVKIPKTIQTVHVRTVSGRMRLQTVLTKLGFQSKSGDLLLATDRNPLTRVEDLTVETVSGDLRAAGRFDRLRFDSVSGDVKLFSLDRVLDINAQTVSGDLEIESADALDTTIEFNSKSGDIQIDDGLLPNAAIAKRNASFTIGKGTAKMKFQTVSGDLKIHRPDSKNDHDDSEEDAPNKDEESARRVVPTDSVVEGSTFQIADSSFLTCVARAALAEGSRLGSLSAKRCVRVVV